VKVVAPGVWLADAAVALHELEGFLNRAAAAGEDAPAPDPEIRFPQDGDFETLGGFVVATAGRVPPVGSLVTWDGLTFTVRAGDERRVSRVEIARRAERPPAEARSAAGA
jgi:CBS domain containing-hemolysin-like protein